MRGLAVAALAGTMTLAQGAPASQVDIEFDAASIKPNNSGSGNTRISMPPLGILRAENVTVRELIMSAHRVRRFQIEGGPDWLDGEHFDIVARSGDGAARNQMHVMLQSLLADRFGLSFHRETRERPIYELMVARGDGAVGAGLVQSTGADKCGLDTNGTNGSFVARGRCQPISNLAEWLGNRGDAERVVVDRSNLPGTWDFELQFTRDNALGRRDAPPGATSLFTALREQLGLKLESARGPVEFLIIDGIRRPTPD
jgi:uncharacterized protein (TIGR03435 family)